MGWTAAVVVVLNLLYAAKSLAGIDLDPSGHNGNLFPLGNWIYHTFRHRPALLSFSGPYVSHKEPKGRVSGVIADGWWDNSSWGDVRIDYRRVSVDGSRGSYAQGVEVRHIGARAACQFVQSVPVVAGHRYRATVTVRSKSPMPLELLLRQGPKPYRVIASTKSKSGPLWTTLTVLGTPTPADIDDDQILFMLRTQDLGTFEVAAATLTEAP